MNMFARGAARTVRACVVVTLVFTAFGCIPQRFPGTEICTDGLDNDDDGFADCGDSDCATHPACVSPGDENCENGIDDDGDSLIDCADLQDCAFSTACASEDCDNGLDDDGDGLTDCDDVDDCTGALGCGAEVCDDGIDNDGDGLIDCIDTDCFQTCIPEVCDNGMDEDGDGLVDCDDEECATTFTDCVAEVCDNGMDDDFDMLLDCLDDECFMFPSCFEVCTDGIDNDQDGDTDCADAGDCGMDPACFESDCTDGIDNDMDGGIDCLDLDCSGDPTCTAPGYYELWGSGFDLDGATLEFTPTGGGTYTWMAMAGPGGWAETPGGGTVGSTNISLSDDSSQMVSFGVSIPFFGANYNAFFIGSNGYVTFNSGDSDYTESVAEHFAAPPRLAMYWDDLNPSSGGTITFDEYTDRVVVSFQNVPEYSSGGANSFQVIIDSAGVITCVYNGLSSTDALVGIANGNPFGLPLPPAVNYL